MTIVVGTAGHIDHGKTTLLRALTGIDADRLPEERRRGMTIDVGYAHLALDDGTEIDFVDVPGHDRLVGNMLVGAGEIDAALLVVAADDGPRAQTLEHLELLDALDIEDGVAVITKLDVLAADDPRRDAVRRAVVELLARTRLAGAPVLGVSSTAGEGIAELRAALVALRDRVVARTAEGHVPTRLAVDRSFGVRGRGAVVTGTLRGGPLEVGASLRLVPGDRHVRVRGLQVHGRAIERAGAGGRLAVNLAGIAMDELRRGLVLADGPAVVASDRLLVALRPLVDLRGRAEARRALGHGAALRLHLGTEHVVATVRRSRRDEVALAGGEEIVRLSLARPIAVAAGDRFVLRWPSPGANAAAGRVLDAAPPSGPSRRRADRERLRALGEADGATQVVAALTALHGVLPLASVAAAAAALGASASALTAPRSGRGPVEVGSFLVAPDVSDDLDAETLRLVAAHHAAQPLSGGLSLAELRLALARDIRRRASLSSQDAALLAGGVVERLVRSRALARDGDLARDAARASGLPAEVLAAMDRLEAALGVPAPPPFTDAVRAAACPPQGVRALESAGRIVRLDADLVYAARTYRELEALALRLAAEGPLTPADFRDATGTSRKFSLAVLEDLDRRGVLVRTPDGHRPGPRARPASGR